MALTKAQLIDLNGNELILDLDADTSITADTDDQIDVKIGGADDFRFTANTFTALSGSSIVVPDSGLTLGSTAVTSTAAELNLIDGGASTGTTAVADADGIITNDGGTMRLTTAATFKTYFQEGISTAFDDLTAGDAAVLISTSSGNITIDATANDTDIIFKGTDNTADITMLTLDGSDAGHATFNNAITSGAVITSGAGLVIADAGNIGSASDTDAIAIGSDGDVTLTQDLELQHDGAILSFGANDEVTLTHVHDTGILLNSTNVIQFNDASQNIGAPSNAILDINATDEIELNATLVDINANVEISGTAVTTGVHTFTAVPVFPNNTIETADIQADAIDGTKIADDAINSEHYTDGSIDTAHIADGQVTTAKLATALFTGATDIGAAIVDADLFLMDDGAGGTIRKTAASRIKTYAGVSGDVTTIDSLFKTDIKIGEDDQTKIDFETADQINFYAGNQNQIKLTNGVLAPVTDSDVDLGTSSLYFKDTFLDTIRTTGVAVFGSPTSASAGGYTGSVQVQTGGANPSLTLNGNVNNDGGVALVLSKSRNATVGSNTIVANNDVVGSIFFAADDGTNMDCQPANIRCLIDGTPGENDTPGELLFGTTADGSANPTDRLKISPAGDVSVLTGNLVMATSGKGIDFAATADLSDGDATPTQELFDDYEEGTWTATVSAASGTITVNSSNDECTYVKIGRHVFLNGSIVISSVSSPSGRLTINNKPFNTTGGEGGHRGTGSMMLHNPASDEGSGLVPMVFEDYAPIRIHNSSSGGEVNANKIQASSELRFAINYHKG